MGPNSGNAVLTSTALCRKGQDACVHSGGYINATRERYVHRMLESNRPVYITGKTKKCQAKNARHAANRRMRADYNQTLASTLGKIISYPVPSGQGGLMLHTPK